MTSQPSEKDFPYYIARKSCRCIGAVVEDDPARKMHVANTVHDWIARGWRVERVSADYLAQHWPEECPHQARQLSPEEADLLSQPDKDSPDTK